MSQDYLPTYKYDVAYATLRDSIKIAYVDEGSKEHPTIVMVHGWGGYIKNWYSTIDELSKDYRCIALDLPGYGLSSMKYYEQEQDYLQFFASIIDEFCSGLNLNEVVLLGHSMGGQISMIATLNEPKWLKALVLAAPAGFETFSEAEANLLIQYARPEAIMNSTEPQVRAAYTVNFVEMPALAEEMIQERLLAQRAPWFREYAKVREMGVRGMLAHPVREQLGQISYPTLVIYGNNDLLIPNRYFHASSTVQDILDIGSEIPQVQLELLENAGHMLQLDQPKNFNHTVKEFLNQQ